MNKKQKYILWAIVLGVIGISNLAVAYKLLLKTDIPQGFWPNAITWMMAICNLIIFWWLGKSFVQCVDKIRES